MTRKKMLRNLFEKAGLKIRGVKVINLCSVDGFPICFHVFDERYSIEVDKLSAVTSSIASLSLATSKQLIGAKFNSTTIETDNGFMLLVKTEIQLKSCILCFLTSGKEQIGSVRFYANKLAKEIKNSNIPAE